MNYTVFISHKKEDEGKALEIKDFLESLGVTCWIDVLDDKLQSQSGAGVTQHIVEQIQKCSHVMVVFTENTQYSYWVPFELGAAYHAERGIATVKWADGDIHHPEYLDEFPLLQPNESDLKIFAEEFLKDSSLRKSLHESVASIGSTGAADDFIRRMNRRL